MLGGAQLGLFLAYFGQLVGHEPRQLKRVGDLGWVHYVVVARIPLDKDFLETVHPFYQINVQQISQPACAFQDRELVFEFCGRVSDVQCLAVLQKHISKWGAVPLHHASAKFKVVTGQWRLRCRANFLLHVWTDKREHAVERAFHHAWKKRKPHPAFFWWIVPIIMDAVPASKRVEVHQRRAGPRCLSRAHIPNTVCHETVSPHAVPRTQGELRSWSNKGAKFGSEKVQFCFTKIVTMIFLDFCSAFFLFQVCLDRVTKESDDGGQ